MLIQQLKRHLLPINTPSDQLASLKPAAVLVPLVLQSISSSSNQWAVIFTQRADHLKHHPGQISFPGGRFEVNDINLCYTAIRETNEEIGINIEHIKLIGQLKQQQTISQYYITPFVGLINPTYQITIDYNEVSKVFTVPLNHLMELNNYQKIKKLINKKQYDYYVLHYKDYNIWGATANILMNFARHLSKIQM